MPLFAPYINSDGFFVAIKVSEGADLIICPFGLKIKSPPVSILLCPPKLKRFIILLILFANQTKGDLIIFQIH